MGVDYFNCSRCNSIECDCGDYVTCDCGVHYCVDCGNKLKLYELFGKNEDNTLNSCFECYNEGLHNKKIDEYNRKINKHKLLMKKNEVAKEKFIIKYQKEHKMKTDVLTKKLAETMGLKTKINKKDA